MGQKRKNVLLIQTDQWSGRYFGYAGHPSVMTPTIDQLARDGLIFDRCYSTCPVCIPARRSLMTGTSPKGCTWRPGCRRIEWSAVLSDSGEKRGRFLETDSG